MWQKKKRKLEKRKICAHFFWFFGPVFLISETSSKYSEKRCAMLCNIVWKTYSRVFFTIQPAGAFRSSQKLTGTKSYHRPFRVNILTYGFLNCITLVFLLKLSGELGNIQFSSPTFYASEQLNSCETQHFLLNFEKASAKYNINVYYFYTIYYTISLWLPSRTNLELSCLFSLSRFSLLIRNEQNLLSHCLLQNLLRWNKVAGLGLKHLTPWKDSEKCIISRQLKLRNKHIFFKIQD